MKINGSTRMAIYIWLAGLVLTRKVARKEIKL